MKKKITLYSLSGLFISGIGLSLVSTVINVWLPLVIKKLIDAKTKIAQQISLNLVWEIVVFVIGSAVIGAVSDYLISLAGDKKIASVRSEIEQQLLALPMSFFADKKSGQLSSRVVNDAQVVKGFMTENIPNGITSVITLAGSFFILFKLDWQLSLLIVVSFSLLIVLISLPIGKVTEKLSEKMQAKLSKLSGQSTENLYNIRMIKLNNAYKPSLSNFKKTVAELYQVSKKTDKIFSVVAPLQTTFTLGVILLIIVYGGMRVQQGSLSMGTMVSFLIYLFQVIGPINELGNFYADYKQAKGATHQLNKILNEKVEDVVYDPAELSKVPVKQDLSLSNVDFSYADQVVLKNLAMTFKSGKKTAIVGPSGAGKTTIINLLTRLYPLKGEGALKLGQTNAEDFHLGTWRSLFAVVTQENSIIWGSVYLNLTFGLRKKPSETEIWSALSKANLADEVRKMPQQLDTVLGEQGVGLSGGQRQRLQIARAYLKKAPFLILDEATSSLDPDSEKIVSDALKNILHDQQVTLIVIAHRLATISDSDQIYFLDQHQVMGIGSHQELLESVPKYRRFVEEQMLQIK